VAIVIPEMGFDEVPMSPVMREDTVTNRKPKTMTRIAARKFPCIGIFGATARNTASSAPDQHDRRREIGSVRSGARSAGGCAEVLQASRADAMIVGSVRRV